MIQLRPQQGITRPYLIEIISESRWRTTRASKRGDDDYRRKGSDLPLRHTNVAWKRCRTGKCLRSCTCATQRTGWFWRHQPGAGSCESSSSIWARVSDPRRHRDICQIRVKDTVLWLRILQGTQNPLHGPDRRWCCKWSTWPLLQRCDNGSGQWVGISESSFMRSMLAT